MRLPAACLLLVAACTSSTERPAPPTAPTLADAGAPQRSRAIAAAIGLDLEIARAVVQAIPDAPEGDCPHVERHDSYRILTGNCALPGGDRISGRATQTKR